MCSERRPALAISARASSTAGLKIECQVANSTRPFACPNASRSASSDKVVAGGFSSSTSLPAPSASWAIPWRTPGGVLTATTPMTENAIKFLQFYLRPEIAALNVAQQMNGTPNVPAQALIPKELADNPNVYPPAEVTAKLQIFEDLGRDLALYDREWTRIKTAQ